MHSPNKVRINSGTLRGRTVTFSEKEVRPTKSIVRKTLFNWLRPVIRGKHCLDCFSGSGILAFEALSEGAGYVLCLDHSQCVVTDLQKNAEKLELTGIDVALSVFPFVLNPKRAFDIVFMDPPFGAININQCLNWLCMQDCLAPGCLIYVECQRGAELSQVAPIRILKKSHSAGVDFYLLALSGETTNDD